MAQSLITIGIALLLIGIILIVIGSLSSTTKGEKSNVKVAFGGFIGFIPFGWASDKQMFYILIALMILALIFFYFLTRI